MSALKTAIVAPMTSKGFSYPTRIQYTFQGKKGLITVGMIENRILLIRGEKVIIDSALAEFYGVPTKRLNEQTKRK